MAIPTLSADSLTLGATEITTDGNSLYFNSQVFGGGVPPGVVVPYAGSSAPAGWLLCYGQSIARTVYPNLFSAIGTVYGSVDGSSFNAPDLRGNVVAGKDDMGGIAAGKLNDPVTDGVDGTTLGALGGNQEHQLSQSELPSVSLESTASDFTEITTPGIAEVAAGGDFEVVTGSGAVNNQVTTALGGAGNSFNTVQPTIILNYIIKY